MNPRPIKPILRFAFGMWRIKPRLKRINDEWR